MRVILRAHVFRDELHDVARRLGIELTSADDLETLARDVPEADALWMVPSKYDAAVAEILKTKAQRLRWIGMTSIGYDPLLRFGIPAGVAVTNTGDIQGPVVAEHAVMLLAALVRQLPAIHAKQLAGEWDASVMHRLRSLEDMTAALVGFGSIGRETARRLRGFGTRIVAVRASGKPDELADETFAPDRLHAALAAADAVVLAVPMNAGTRGLIDRAAFAAMRPHTLLVNVARGPVVDTAALRDALHDERIAGAALDVTDPEPLPAGDPLWSDPRVLISPHVGGFGSAAVSQRLARLFERNARHVLAGEPLEACVDLSPAR